MRTMIEGTRISVNFCRRNSHAAGESFSLGRTRDCDLIAVTEGGYEYRVDGAAYRVSAGDVFLVPEGCTFSGRAASASSHYYCHFSLDGPLRVSEGTCPDEETRRVFFGACRDGDDYLLACVIRIVLYRQALSGSMRASPDIPEGILAAVKAMREHPERNISAVELANIADLSYGYFFKSFRRAMGVSPIQYRDRLRLDEAKRMLLTGSSVKETAKALHYSDMFSFSKRFKQHFHVSPSGMRKLNEQKV